MLTVGGGLISGAESPSIASIAAPFQQQPGNQPAPAGVDALAQLVKERYGKYLSEAQLAEIKQGIDRNLRTSERYSRLKLENGDEPDFRFYA